MILIFGMIAIGCCGMLLYSSMEIGAYITAICALVGMAFTVTWLVTDFLGLWRK